MEYNQYWNEIKGPSDEPKKEDEAVKNEDVVSFSYDTVSEEPQEKEHGGLISPDAYEYLDDTKDDELLHDAILEEENLFDDDDDSDEESDEFDDSKMYSNSSLFDLIDDLEESDEEDKEEKEEKIDDSRFVSFEFDDKSSDEDDKDVHIFADELEQVLEEEDVEPVATDSTPIDFSEPEPVSVVIEDSTPICISEPEPVVEEPVAVSEPEPAVEQVIPHFECPVFEDNNQETEPDIDKLIEEAKQKESSQKKLMDSELLPLLRDIISFMPAECAFIDYIASLSNDDRKDLVRVIEQAINACAEDGNDKMFTIADGEVTIGILSNVADPMRDVQRLEAAGAQMFSYDKESWSFVKIFIDDNAKLLRADAETITKDSFNSWQWRVVQQTGFNLWKSRQ